MGLTSAFQIACERDKITLRVTQPVPGKSQSDDSEQANQDDSKKDEDVKKEDPPVMGSLEDDKVMAAWGGASFRGNQQFDVIPKE
jgi:hypothetical protein